MIREYNIEDKACMIQIMRQGFESINQEDLEFLFGKDNKILVFEKENVGIVGFCSFGRWGENKENGKIFNYVAPAYRKMKIGSALYQAMMDYAKALHLNIIETVFRVDINDAASYYYKRGFKKWYGLHVMRYNGGKQSYSDSKIIPYEDCFFEQYVDCMRNSFYEMRKVNDFRPYYCVDFDEKLRKELLNDKNNLFIMVIGGRLVASAAVHPDSTDALGPIFVAPSFQGKGYGKIITQFAINEALERGMTSITLEVVEWNKRAVNLYTSLGFEIIQTTNSYRLFNK